MKKFRVNRILIIAILSLVWLCVSSNSASAQSVNGKMWQCQTSSLSEKSTLLIFDDKNLIRVCPTIIPGDGGQMEVIGTTTFNETFTETPTTISITSKKLFSKKMRTDTYEIEWLNNESFVIYISGEKFTYALFRSSSDRFTHDYPGLYENY